MRTIPTNATPSTSDRLTDAQKTVAELAAAQRRSNRFTLFAGIASLLLMSGYFYFIYNRVTEHLQPEAIVELAQAKLEDQWPEARDALESHVKNSAPEWAGMLTQRAQEAIPEARLFIQDYALKRSDEMADEAISLSEEQVRDHIREQRPLYLATYKELAESPEAAQERLTELRTHFEEQLDEDFNLQMKQLLATVEQMNAKLALLRAGTDLTPEQLVERRVLMLARRLQADHLTSTSVLPDMLTDPLSGGQ